MEKEDVRKYFEFELAADEYAEGAIEILKNNGYDAKIETKPIVYAKCYDNENKIAFVDFQIRLSKAFNFAER